MRAKSYPYERPVEKLDYRSQRRYYLREARLRIIKELEG